MSSTEIRNIALKTINGYSISNTIDRIQYAAEAMGAAAPSREAVSAVLKSMREGGAVLTIGARRSFRFPQTLELTDLGRLAAAYNNVNETIINGNRHPALIELRDDLAAQLRAA